MPEVSVVIPTFNRAGFVVKAVQSVLNQTFNDWELIVVDDGSTDDTRSALKQFEGRIRYVHQSNSGVSAARNTGIRAATGQWLAFLDSDDEWTAGYLARQMASVDKVPGLCMQTANCVFRGLNGERQTYFEMNGILRQFNGSGYILVKRPFRFVVEHGPWQVGATVFLSDALRKAGLFDTSLSISEDMDLMARVALLGSFGLIREALVNIYRRDEANGCLTGRARKNPVAARESDERIYLKLAEIEGLRHDERRALKKLTSANRRAIGNLLLKNGMRKEARDCYKRALSLDHSVRSLGRYLLSFAPQGLTSRGLGAENADPAQPETDTLIP
jgi:glycosyltransferase involved in cell wall biosynthesis